MMANDDSHNQSWEWNWIRQSLVEGSMAFTGLASATQQSELAELFAELAAADLNSASRLSAAIREAGLHHVRILKPLQWFFQRHIDGTQSDVEVVALSRVVQWRLLRRMSDALESGDLPVPLAEAVEQVLAAGRQSIDCLSAYLEGCPEAEGWLARYREADRRVSHEMRPFEGGLSKIPGLGRESLSSVPA